MAIGYSPQIVTNGLVFAYDMQNTKKSFKGKPTTNLLYDTTNFSSAANEWNAQENVTVTRGQIAPDGQIQINCVKVKCNSATDSYFGVRSSALTNGNAIHSFSFWAKANKNFTMPIKFGSNQYTATMNLTQNWQYFSVSCPANLGLSVYLHFGGWGSLTDNTLEFYVYQPMYEESSFSTQFVPGGTSRSNTQVIVDLVGNNTVTANSLTYNSDGTFSFNSTSDYITPSSISDTFLNGGSWTMSAFVRFTSVNRGTDNAIFGHGSASANNGLHLAERGGYVYFGFYANDLGGTKQLSAGNWYEITFVFDYATKSKTIYVNGAYDNGGGSVGYSGTGSNFQIGQYPWSPGNRAYGSISTARIYNRALSAAEVKQNFNALRGRYSI